MGLAANILIDGIAYGMVLFMIAVGLTITLGLMRVVNLAHGLFAMLGGYAFWSLTSGKIASLPHLVALPLALLFVLAVGALLEFAVYRPLRNASPLGKLIAIFCKGIVIALVEIYLHRIEFLQEGLQATLRYLFVERFA